MRSYFALGVIGLATSWVLALIVRRLAPEFGLVDKPDGRRKTHGRVVSLGGGLAVFVSYHITLAVGLFVSNPLQSKLWGDIVYLAGLSLAATLLCGVGLMDDRFGLRGRQKLFAQLVACSVVVAFGLSFNKISLFGMEIELGILAWPFTVFWLLGAINAVNLMDGIDGLAGSLGVIICLAMAAMSVNRGGREVDVVVAIALAASLAGFLRFNLPPASLFLGDAGSMIIGMLVGATAIHSALKGPATVALTAPVALLAVPILDSVAAVMRRKLTGRSIYMTDRGHLHHCFLHRGFTNWQTLGWIGLLCGATCTGALFSVFYKSEALAAASVVVMVAMLVSTRVFGYAEYLLLRNRIVAFGRSLLSPATRKPAGRESAVQIQGERSWDPVWRRMREFAEEQGVQMLRLDLNLPQLHQSYHAHWVRAGHHEESEYCWKCAQPVFLGDQLIGRLELEGSPNCRMGVAGLGQTKILVQMAARHAEHLVDEAALPSDSEAELVAVD